MQQHGDFLPGGDVSSRGEAASAATVASAAATRDEHDFDDDFNGDFFDKECSLPDQFVPHLPPGRDWGFADPNLLVRRVPGFSVNVMINRTGIGRASDWLPYTRKEKHVRPRIAVLTVSTRVFRNDTLPQFDRHKMAIISFTNKQQYCARHGYDFIVEDESTLPRNFTRSAAWTKVFALLKWLPVYDWVMWADLDMLFMNHTHKIESVIEFANQNRTREKKQNKNSDATIDFIFTVQPSSAQLWALWPKPKSEINTGIFFVRGGGGGSSSNSNSGSSASFSSSFSRSFLLKALQADKREYRSKMNANLSSNHEQDAFSYLLGASRAHWKTQCEKGPDAVAEVIANRRRVLILHEHQHQLGTATTTSTSSSNMHHQHTGWNTFLWQSLVRFDTSRQPGWPRARPWAYNSSNAAHVVLHLVACKRTAYCLFWFEWWFRQSVMLNYDYGRVAAGGRPTTFWEPCVRRWHDQKDLSSLPLALRLKNCPSNTVALPPRILYPPPF